MATEKGVKTREYIEKDNKFGAGNYAPLPVVLERGEGVYVWDVEGDRYFDMLSAYSAINQGHCHPRIIKAAKDQMDRLCLTSRAFHNNVMGDFLEKICQLTGFEKALPMNSGAEGVETAIKAMRRWGYQKKGIPENKAEILVCTENFHGRTTTIVGFSTDPGATEGFGPATPGFKIVEFNSPEDLEKAINKNTCGFLVEPIQGEAGVKMPDDDYLVKVREICTRENVLFCADEVQTGLGRTGALFCYQHSGIKPDIVIMGKALSGGVYPISAIACDNDIMEVFTAGSHGSTYGGNPLASVIGIAALDVIVEEDLPAKATEKGAYFVSKLVALNNPAIKDIRGKGLLIAIEFYAPVAKKFCKQMQKEGVLAKDTHDVTVRFAPPLVITNEQIDDAFARICRALDWLVENN